MRSGISASRLYPMFHRGVPREILTAVYFPVLSSGLLYLLVYTMLYAPSSPIWLGGGYTFILPIDTALSSQKR